MTELLTTNDYKQILDFYHISIPKSSRLIKKTAEKILNEKLCRCIKKVDPINETRSIAICTKTIFKNNGLTRGKFSCNKKRNIKIQKIKKNNTKRQI